MFLTMVIKEIKSAERYIEIEKVSGPLINKFIIGGVYNDTIISIRLHSKNKYKIKKDEFLSCPDISYLIDGSTEEAQKKVEIIFKKKMHQMRSLSEIEKIIRYIISKAAELHPNINNHVFIRRLSRNFDLEKYICYK